MSDPLERRIVPCPKCENGKVREWLHNEYITVDCPDCSGTGQVPEPSEVWAERNAAILHEVLREEVRGEPEWLEEYIARRIRDAEEKIATRLEAAAKECDQ